MADLGFSSLAEAQAAILRFRDERDWGPYHTPRHLAAALSIEAAELQQELLWKSDEEARHLLTDPAARERLANEIADVFIFALLLCHTTGTDPLSAVAHKLELNRHKYPVCLARGNARKYSELPDKAGNG
jgi:NTP pyrophosphatase (non-canonical NTP hydrolase)